MKTTDSIQAVHEVCLLAAYCDEAGSQTCNTQCPAFIQMHGVSGKGGRVAAANIPEDYEGVTLSTSKARDGQENLYGQLDVYVKTFARQFMRIEKPSDQIKSWYLFSQASGTGKTTTAAALLNEWIRRHYLGSIKRGEKPLDLPGYFLDVNEWQNLYNGFARDGIPREIKEKNAAKYYEWMEKAKKAPFVVLDDIGVRTATEGFRGDLHSVIQHRVSNKLITIYTSNIPLAEMEHVFESRLFDRMRHMTFEVGFGGTSNRGIPKRDEEK